MGIHAFTETTFKVLSFLGVACNFYLRNCMKFVLKTLCLTTSCKTL